MQEYSLQTLLDILQERGIKHDPARISLAYKVSAKAHDGQKRSSGEPYITHPLAVAHILTNINCDESMIIAALLHDTIEDTDLTEEEVDSHFGKEVAELVSGLTKIAKVEAIGIDRQLVSIRRMFMAMSKDIRVIYVKLADRLHNMQTLSSLRAEKKKRIAEETLSIYAPIATRLGVYYFKNELEELCFQALHPKEYNDITKQLTNYNKTEEKIAETATTRLERRMQREGANYVDISWREKSHYSILRKLRKRKESDISNVYDIFAVRVITDSVESCYKILGVIHKYWKPLSNRFKDYIAVPKSNGYQSLHTTVLGLGKSGTAFKPVEIQIRTQEMHDHAEKGSAAHWMYKAGKDGKDGKEGPSSDWVQSLVSIADELQHSEDLFSNVKEDILNSRIFVITPKGDIKDLPKSATPIDFAYSVHTHIGNHLASARVNGKVVPLNSTLKNGDIVEVKTSKNRSPNPAWMNVVKTSHAKSSIKQWLRQQSQENILRLGREEMNKFLKKLGKDSLDKDYTLLKTYKGRDLTLRERENLIAHVGEGSQKASDIIKNIINKQTKRPVQRVSVPMNEQTTETEIFVMGDTSFETRISSCCKPTAEKRITGFITRGGYVSIHAMDCSFVINAKEDRFVECHWANEEMPFEVEFTFRVKNVVGVTSKVINFFAKNNINILTIDAQTNKARGIGNDRIVIETNDLDRLNWIVEHLESISGLIDIDYKVLS